MSQFTLTIREIINAYVIDSAGAEEVPKKGFEERIEIAKDRFWSFDFPWVNEDSNSKEEFKRLFLMHFYEKEIGFETLELFKMHLKSRMVMKMPEWKAIYKALEDALKNMYENVNIEEHESHSGELGENNGYGNTYGSTVNDTGKVVGSTNSAGKTAESQNYDTRNDTNTQSIDSDNPQTNFSGTDYASSMTRTETVDEKSGLDTKDTNTTQDTSMTEDSTNGRVVDGHENGTSEKSRTDRYENWFTRKGRDGINSADQLRRIRKNYESIYQIMFVDLERLFMGVMWSADNSFIGW